MITYETKSDWLRLKREIGEGLWEGVHGTLRKNLPDIEKIGLIGLLGDWVKEAYEEDIEALMDHYEVTNYDDLEWALDRDDKLAVFLAPITDIQRSLTALSARLEILRKGSGFGHSVTENELREQGALLLYKSIEWLHIMDENQDIFEIVDVFEIQDQLLNDAPFDVDDADDEEIENYLQSQADFLDKYTLVKTYKEMPLGIEPNDIFAERLKVPDAVVIGDALVALYNEYTNKRGKVVGARKEVVSPFRKYYRGLKFVDNSAIGYFNTTTDIFEDAVLRATQQLGRDGANRVRLYQKDSQQWAGEVRIHEGNYIYIPIGYDTKGNPYLRVEATQTIGPIE